MNANTRKMFNHIQEDAVTEVYYRALAATYMRQEPAFSYMNHEKWAQCTLADSICSDLEAEQKDGAVDSSIDLEQVDWLYIAGRFLSAVKQEQANAR